MFPHEYGPEFDQALQVLVGHFLSRLEQLLPIPSFKQVGPRSQASLQVCVLHLIAVMLQMSETYCIPPPPDFVVAQCLPLGVERVPGVCLQNGEFITFDANWYLWDFGG